MKRHWREHHGWKVPYKGGRPMHHEREQAQTAIQQGYQVVTCQRFFPSRKGSHYIYIHQPNDCPPPPPTNAIETAVGEVIQAWEQAQAQAKAQQTVQASELTDANPWLRMTGWADYLQGISEKNLRDCVEAPDEDPQDATKQRVQVIWATMEQVARKSQRTVQQCGQAIQG
ncbi:hypothetical protein LV164_008821 [Aspergillus fumigatus]|nr:hypothetical protein LV164_008821 [Aspergillus fumigatus]